MFLIGLLVANPHSTHRISRCGRPTSMLLAGMITTINAWSAVRLVQQFNGSCQQDDAEALLSSGGAIWATNVLLFALWYWELDGGGPFARARGHLEHLDLAFPRCSNPSFPTPQEPPFPDYLYLSFTQRDLIQPTDVMPLTRWTKMTMLAQSVVSLITIALVICRAAGLIK